MSQAVVSSIRIYPVKSLDPVEVSETEIGLHSLKHDRAFAIMGEDGRYINGKRTGKVNQLKASYDLEKGLISLSPRGQGQTETFELNVHNKELNKYLADFFEMKLHLVYSDKGELLDEPYKSCTTIISQATYESLLADLPQHTIEDLRLRFRTNIEIKGVESFWEEQLFKSPSIGIRYSIGDVEMIGISPRARCNVPPRDPFTGETDKSFIKTMMQSREQSLPKDSSLALFGNTYHLSVDTYIPPTELGKKIRVGEDVKIGEAIGLSGLG